MPDNIKPKEATSIINSLLGGVVPKVGVQHISVGRDLETKSIVRALDDVSNGQSLVKFWIGDFGSGKSFMLHLLSTVALQKKFVISKADFTPDTRIYATDGKAVALYTAIMDNLSIQTKPEGGALVTLLEKWVDQVIMQCAHQNNLSPLQIRETQYLPLIHRAIMETINQLTDSGGFDFGQVIIKFYEGHILADDLKKRNALKWLKGEYSTKTEARQDLGVREIINDQNYYDMLKNFCRLFVSIGYKGFMINLDEAVNLYKISTAAMRERNYEKILSIYNDCLQGRISNFILNFAGTKDFLENPRRGLFSYNALKTRLESNKYETADSRDFDQPVIKLYPLSHAEIFVLLEKLKSVFDIHYKTNIAFDQDDIHAFMEDMFNKPGASEFLTPREVIRDFLNILNILRQNPDRDKKELVGEINIEDERPQELSLDNIEEF
jgi:hypothetical protein